MYNMAYVTFIVLNSLFPPQIFEKYMLDAEWSINAGSWMWLSCSAFFAKHPQWTCPVGLGKHLDPQGNYVRYLLLNSLKKRLTNECELVGN